MKKLLFLLTILITDSGFGQDPLIFSSTEIKEDILVNVRYELDKMNDNKESYQIKDEGIMFVPEID